MLPQKPLKPDIHLSRVRKKSQHLIDEICNGYGFEKKEIDTGDGFCCEGCLQTIKRPAKMYYGKGNLYEKLCRHCVGWLYGD